MPVETAATINSGKNRYLAAILAWFLGIFGIHKFYIGQWKKGLLFFVFSWTAIPALIGFANGVHYLVMDDEEFHLRVTGEYDGSEKQQAKAQARQEQLEQITEETESESESGSFADNVPDEAVAYAEGKNGQVILFEDKVRITREDISLLQKTQQWGKGEKEILMQNVTSVQLREPSSFTVGYIQFGQEGYVQESGSQFDAVSDENSVTFTKDSLEDFKEIRDRVQELKTEDVEMKSGGKDPVDALELRYAEGEISEEEFKRKKEILTED